MLDSIGWMACYLQTGMNEYTGLVDQYLKLIGNSPSRNLRPRECTPVVDQRSKEAIHLTRSFSPVRVGSPADFSNASRKTT